MSALRVIKPGLLTTVQDLGRRGYRGLGVGPAGPMDWYSHRLANRLVGNDVNAAALEITLIGPELEAGGDVLCAIAGAEFDADVDGAPIAAVRPFGVPAGARLRVRTRRQGARAYLAVRGGFDVPPVLGSRATHLVSAIGPFDGRALQSGDELPVGGAAAPLRFFEPRPLPAVHGACTVRVLPGPHCDRFTDQAWAMLCDERFRLSPESNRMGYRLSGPLLAHTRGADILSEATPAGAIQVPSSGQPILLMADRQTTGGYTIIGAVITADLPLAAQLAPGDEIRFAACTREEAIAALRDRMRWVV